MCMCSSDDHAYLGSRIPSNRDTSELVKLQLFQIREVYKYYNLFIQNISEVFVVWQSL